jgi:hypothetical protein
MRIRSFSLAALLAALALILSDLRAGDEFKSGLAPGKLIGGPFQPYTLNDSLTRAAVKRLKEAKNPTDELLAKGRFHCLVCEFGLKPVLAIFVREGQDSNEAVLKELLKKVDDAVESHQESYLNSFAVFLTPDARSSITEKKIEDTEALVTESAAREKLTARLEELAKPLNHVVVGFYPAENLKGYDISAQPGVTILLYAKHKVLANYAFAEGKLKSEDIDRVIKGVGALLKKGKKKS